MPESPYTNGIATREEVEGWFEEVENNLLIIHTLGCPCLRCSAQKTLRRIREYLDETLAALKEEMAWDMGDVPENEWMRRALAAEERVAALEAALAKIDDLMQGNDEMTWHGMHNGFDEDCLVCVARAALERDTQ